VFDSGKGKELAEQQKKTDRGAVDLGRMSSEIEGLEQEIAKVLEEQAEEEAQHELQVAELRQQCEEQEKILIELRQKHAELDYLKEEANIAAEAAAAEAEAKGRQDTLCFAALSLFVHCPFALKLKHRFVWRRSQGCSTDRFPTPRSWSRSQTSCSCSWVKERACVGWQGCCGRQASRSGCCKEKEIDLPIILLTSSQVHCK